MAEFYLEIESLRIGDWKLKTEFLLFSLPKEEKREKIRGGLKRMLLFWSRGVEA